MKKLQNLQVTTKLLSFVKAVPVNTVCRLNTRPSYLVIISECYSSDTEAILFSQSLNLWYI